MYRLYKKHTLPKFPKSKFKIHKRYTFDHLQLSIHTRNEKKIQKKTCIFSILLNTFRENLTSNEISQNVKHDLQKILSWFIIDDFYHKIDLKALSRKNGSFSLRPSLAGG